MKKIEITPQTYIDMNQEFVEEDVPFRIDIPTQETIDEWQSRPSLHLGVVHDHDMVAEIWKKHNENK